MKVKKVSLLYIFLVVLLLLFSTSFAFAQEPLEVKVGVYDNYPKVAINGEPIGFWVDLTEEIARQEGWNIKYISGTWTEGLERLESGDIDLMVDVAYSKQRAEIYDFSDEAAILSWSGIFAPEDSGISDYQDLQDKKVAVLHNSINYRGKGGVVDLLNSFAVDVDYVEEETYDEAFAAVVDGDADVVVTNRFFGASHAGQYGMVDTPMVFLPSKLKFGISKNIGNGRYLADRIDFRLKEMKEDKESIYFDLLDALLAGTVYEKTIRPQLTDEEKAWLEEHPKLSMAIPINKPQSYYAEDGTFQGMTVDYINLIEQKLGVSFDLHISEWPTALDRALKHEVDIIVNADKTKSREPYLEFTEPYFIIHQAMIAHESKPKISDLSELSGKTVAVRKDSSRAEYLRDNYPDIELLEVLSKDEIVSSVVKGDAYVGFDNLDSIISFQKELLVPNTKIIYLESIPPMGHARMGVRKDYPMLASILDKAIASISNEEKADIQEKWIGIDVPVLTKEKDLVLTGEERAWLADHRVIKVTSEYDWPPFDFTEDGKSTGISIDYIELLGEKAGIDFEFVQGTWADNLKKFKNREIDLLHPSILVEERKEFTNFLPPHITVNNVLVVRDSDVVTQNVKDLEGKKIAVVEGYANHEIIPEYHPNIELVTAKSPLHALSLISKGEVDGYIDNLLVVEYLIKKNFLGNLKILHAADIPVYKSMQLHIGVRSDWPILHSILEKAMDEVSVRELSEIYAKWGISFIEPIKQVNLTESEKVWLAKHPSITLGFTSELEPLLIQDEKGNISGIVPEIFDKLEERIGVDINIKVGSWPEIQEQTQTGEIDGLLNCVPALAENLNLLKTDTFYHAVPVFFGRLDSKPQVDSIDDIKGLTIVHLKGVKMLEDELKPVREHITVIESNSTKESFRLLLEGKADLVLGINYDTYYLKKYILEGIEIVFVNFDHEVGTLTAIRQPLKEKVRLMHKIMQILYKNLILCLLQERR